jgi:hypothetical protein
MFNRIRHANYLESSVDKDAERLVQGSVQIVSSARSKSIKGILTTVSGASINWQQLGGK